MAGPSKQDQHVVIADAESTGSSKDLASAKPLQRHGAASDVLPAREERLKPRANKSNSDLLCLPLEVRLMIYRALIGEKLVHVHFNPSDIESKSWRHVICQGDGAKASEEQHSRRLEDDWEPAHYFCRNDLYPTPVVNNLRAFQHQDTMHLSILRCCQQVYHEANPILWSTNTFSIHDHDTLGHFMRERNAVQKSYTKTLRLRFNLTSRAMSLRRSILTSELMFSFPRLETLYLVLEDELPSRLALMMGITRKSLAELGGNRMDPSLEVLSLLPLKEVFVHVDSIEPSDPQTIHITQRWRAEYAEMVQKSLLCQRT